MGGTHVVFGVGVEGLEAPRFWATVLRNWFCGMRCGISCAAVFPRTTARYLCLCLVE